MVEFMGSEVGFRARKNCNPGGGGNNGFLCAALGGLAHLCGLGEELMISPHLSKDDRQEENKNQQQNVVAADSLPAFLLFVRAYMHEVRTAPSQRIPRLRRRSPPPFYAVTGAAAGAAAAALAFLAVLFFPVPLR